MRAMNKTLIAAVVVGCLSTVVTSGAAQAQAPAGPAVLPWSASAALPAAPAAAPLAASLNGVFNQKSGKYLTPQGFSTGIVNIVQQPFDNNTVQVWSIEAHGSYFVFHNIGSDKCLGIDGASTAPDKAAIQAKCDGTTNQDWSIPNRSNTVVELHNRKSSLCLGIDGASKDNGKLAKQFKCDGTTNQGWLRAAVQ